MLAQGLYKLGGEYWMVTENFFFSGHALRTRFDLKGSTHGRRASERERAKGSKVS